MSREMMLREVAITKILGARSWPSFLQCRFAKKKKKEGKKEETEREQKSCSFCCSRCSFEGLERW